MTQLDKAREEIRRNELLQEREVLVKRQIKFEDRVGVVCNLCHGRGVLFGEKEYIPCTNCNDVGCFICV